MNEIYDFLGMYFDFRKKHMSEKRFRAKEIFYNDVEDNRSQKIVLIEKGIVVVETFTDERWEVKTFLSHDDFAGIDAFLGEDKIVGSETYRIKALTDGVCHFIDKEYFINHMYANARIFHTVIEKLTMHYMFSSHNNRKKRAPLDERLADFFVEFINMTSLPLTYRYAEVPITVNKYLIASFLRVHHSRVQKVINTWIAEGIMSRDSEHYLIDYGELVEISSLFLFKPQKIM